VDISLNRGMPVGVEKRRLRERLLPDANGASDCRYRRAIRQQSEKAELHESSLEGN
jgi:hypothetical protein